MLHVPLSAPDQHALLARPLAAADYLRLRRTGAGLSLPRAAMRFAVEAPDLSLVECEDALRLFEAPGVVMKPWVAAGIDRAFPFDAGIYFALAELPPEQHPTLCRGCGWDVHAIEQDLQGNAVRWIEPGWCSRCEQRLVRDGLADFAVLA